MNLSYRWLRALLPSLTDSPAGIADRLAMYGAPVDEVVDLGGPLRDILIARVLEVGRHPNADRLSLCKVDAGTGEALGVVCGATNVKAGGWYPFVPAGATLPGGLTIRRAKIRGEESNGMLCSARELGLGRDHEGILELHGEFAAGGSFIEQVGLDDTRIVVDVTPNRPDLLSHWGVARELSVDGEASLVLAPFAGRQAPVTFATVTGTATAEAAGIRIMLEDTAGCPRYFGAVIRNVKIGPSPEWLACRLRAVGLRPINNVVDATNFVLHELGQPLHAFDLDAAGGSIVVRRARAGESLVTLDGETRKLSPDVLVIADANRPVALAGIMGGLETEVTDSTTNLLLECALFEPKTIRGGRRLLGMSTDASYRFERGVDPDSMERAVRRALELIVATAGGEVDARVPVADAGVPQPRPIRLRQRRVVQVLGIALSRSETVALLEPLGFVSEPVAAEELSVRVPGHRRYDVEREDDLIEEVARRRGYDAFPDDVRAFRSSAVPDDPMAQLEDRLRDLLVARGFLEARSLPLVSSADGDVPLMHPLATTESRLRRALLPGLVHRLEANFNRGARDVRLFEIGTAFAPGGDDAAPGESTRVAILFTGARDPEHWTGPVMPFDLWDLRGFMAELGRALGLEVEPGEPDDAGGLVQFDEGTVYRLRGGDARDLVGVGGRVADEAIDSPAWAGDVWGAEVRLRLSMAQRETVRFRPLPAHPPVERDVALVLPAGLAAGAVEATIRAGAGTLLEHVAPFDVYAGEGLPTGGRSVAFRLRFRAADRTLTLEEVDALMDRILNRLGEEHHVERRG